MPASPLASTLCCVPRAQRHTWCSREAQRMLVEKRGSAVSSEAKGHARSGVQGESTVSGCDGATSLDLCPRPATIAAWVFFGVGEGKCPAWESRFSALSISRTTPRLVAQWPTGHHPAPPCLYFPDYWLLQWSPSISPAMYSGNEGKT